MRSEVERALRAHLRGLGAAMLVIRDADGHPRARPMWVADCSREGDLWFVTSAESGTVDELQHDPRVMVTMQSSHRYLSITGRATVIDDRRQIDNLWRPSMGAWFAEGKDDPRLVIVRVIGERAEVWSEAGVFAHAFEATRALLTGHRPAQRGRHAAGSRCID